MDSGSAPANTSLYHLQGQGTGGQHTQLTSDILEASLSLINLMLTCSALSLCLEHTPPWLFS